MIQIICDFLKLSFPSVQGPSVRDALDLFLSPYPVVLDSADYYSCPNGGGLRMGYRGSVYTLQVSGSAIEFLRSHNQFGQFLAMVFDFDHRVTMLDAALDIRGEDTGAILRGLYNSAAKGKHQLTRKTLDPDRHLKKLFSPGDDGKDTGTVYLGRRGKSEVYCRIYDKRKERIDNGHPDPGEEIIRYEVSVTGKMSPTLKDAFDPTALFWSFMGRTLLKAPDGVLSWSGHAEGFELPKRQVIEPYQALLNAIEQSEELKKLARIAAMSGASGCGRLQREVSVICDDELRLLSASDELPILNLVPLASIKGS